MDMAGLEDTQHDKQLFLTNSVNIIALANEGLC